MSWLVSYCSEPGCGVRIRAMVGELTIQCKWHAQGNATLERNPTQWPYCMPNPSLPWPWVTDAERERKIRSHLWQEQFRAHRPIYDHWILNLEAE